MAYIFLNLKIPWSVSHFFLQSLDVVLILQELQNIRKTLLLFA